MPLVGSIDVPREAPPEVSNGHGVVVQHPVVPDPPEPPALERNRALAEDGEDTATLLRCPPTHYVPKEGAGGTPGRYLEHKHLPTQHRHRVKVPIADVRAVLVRSVWAARFGGSIWFPRRGRFRGSLIWPARSPGCHGGQRLGGLRVPICGTWIRQVREGMW